jgi:hypothetical protein
MTSLQTLSATTFRPLGRPAARLETSAPAAVQAAPDLVSLNGQVLEPAGSARVQAGQLGAAAAENGLAAATGAGGGLPALVLQYFTPGEWAQLNPGVYHDEYHPVHVANTVADVAHGLGRTPERAEFLQQVALLHDVDERINLSTGAQNKTSPARVPVTLEWMDRNQDAISGRMGWDGADFAEAKALIARTDFPFNDKAKNLGTRYDGQAPVELYEKLLQDVPVERRRQTMEDGLMLRFADQVGNYSVDKEQSSRYIAGLAEEMRGVGIQITNEQLAKGSPDFLRSVGTEMQDDWNIAGNLNIPSSGFADRDQLLTALSPARREAFLELQREGHDL